MLVRAFAIASLQRGSRWSWAASAITGKVSDRSAPSGIQISLHTSQSARADSVTVLPLRKSGPAAMSFSSRTSPA